MALFLFRNVIHKNQRWASVRRYCERATNHEEAEARAANKKGLVVGVYIDEAEGEMKLTAAGQKISNMTGGKLEDLIRDSRPLTNGRVAVFQNLEGDFNTVAVAGLGREDAGFNDLENLDVLKENIRVAAAVGARSLRKEGIGNVYIDNFGNAEAAAEGATLGVWRYQENKNKEDHKLVPKLHLFGEEDPDGWQRGVFKAESQNLARRLSDAPANLMTPAIFAQNAVDILCPCGVSVEVRDRDWAELKKMYALLAAAKGSCEPPIILELSYSGGSQEDKPIAFVGKGVTFDSGGLCLKKCKGMSEFRADMAGAAVVVAVMHAAAQLSLPLNIQAVIPLCENMPSGLATKPGDVVFAMNGKSIRIDNSDHEGRLTLADGLTYVSQQFKPKLIIDVATLTHGVLAALGDSASGVFTNNNNLWDELNKAGSFTGDRVWRMPLWEHFRQKIANIRSADLTNVGVGPGGGPCRAAAFLREFIPCGDWIHLDIASGGMKAHTADFPYLQSGRMTGRPTRTIIQFLYQLACPPKQ